MGYYEKNYKNKSKINISKFDFNNVVLEHKQKYKERINSAKRKFGLNQNLLIKRSSYLQYLKYLTGNKKKKYFYKRSLGINVFNIYKKFPSFVKIRKKKYRSYHKIYSRFYEQKKLYKNRFQRRTTTTGYRLYGDSIGGFFFVRKGEFKRKKKGFILRNIKFLRRIFVRTVFPQSLTNYLLYEENMSATGPFSNSIELHSDTAQLALNFHKNLLHQYELHLILKNKKAQEGFLNLKQYLESENYIHDILYSMPGLRWNQNEVEDVFSPSNFSYEKTTFLQLMESDLSDMNNIKQIQDLEILLEHAVKGSFDSYPYHLEEGNIKFLLNPSYDDMDDKFPIWRAFHRVYVGIRHQLENHSDLYFLYDWFAYFHFIPFLIYPMIFPAFTTTDKPQRTMSYFKPWTKSPKYIPYMKEMFFKFQKKRAMHDIFIKNTRRRIPFLTKFFVFSFICFFIFF